MQSKASTVGAYLDEVPADRRVALTRLREMCLSQLSGYTEGMAYGMPSYKAGGQVEVAFASQQNDIALYVLKQDVLDQYRSQLADVGKGCIRYPRPDKIDFDVVERLLAGTASSSGRVC